MKYQIKPILVGSAIYQEELHIRDLALRRPIGRSIRNDDLSGEDQYDHFGIFEDGLLIGTLYRKPLSSDTAQIKQVAILEDHRKGGLGRFLFQFVEEDSRLNGYRKLLLDSRPDAAGFYEKIGFHKTGEIKYYFALPHYCMEKEL